MDRTSYVFSFRMVFSYLVTTGLVLDISLLRENSIIRSIKNQTANRLISSFKLFPVPMGSHVPCREKTRLQNACTLTKLDIREGTPF